jgi:hypothetical protein
MALEISSQSLTAEERFRFQARPRRIFSGQICTETGLCFSTLVSVITITPNLLYTHYMSPTPYKPSNLNRLQRVKACWLVYVPPGLVFKILPSARTLYLCVLCESQETQRIFSLYTALADWCLYTEAECVFCAVRTEPLNVFQFSLCL